MLMPGSKQGRWGPGYEASASQAGVPVAWGSRDLLGAQNDAIKPVRAYALRRVGYLIPLWLGLTIFSFALGKMSPGDPAYDFLRRQLGTSVEPSAEQLREVRAEMGLDRPAPVQYASWLAGALRGDLGVSLFSGRQVSDSLRDALPTTVQLALASFGLALVLGIPLGVLAALHRGRLLDHAFRLLSLAGASMPSYWKGYLLIILFAVNLGWLPSQGTNTASSYLLPSLTLALGSASVLLRLTRASVLEVLGEDHVLAARARGVPRSRVITRHTLRAAFNPILTSAGLLIGGLLGGAVIIETVFSMPGVGKLVVDAANARDFPVIQGFVLYLGTIVLLVNLAVDFLYVALDPRVRLVESAGEGTARAAA